VKFRRWADGIGRDDELHRLKAHEARGIVEDRAHVLCRGGAAGVGMSETARVLLLQGKTRAVRESRCQRDRHRGHCRRDGRSAKRCRGHSMFSSGFLIMATAFTRIARECSLL
jgi:hypothetical protein